MVSAVDVVALERDVTITGREKLGSLVGAEHHGGVVEREVHREDEWLAVENDREAAKPTTAQQSKTFLIVQYLKTRTSVEIRPHDPECGRRNAAAPEGL
jgi:hypothetical protein